MEETDMNKIKITIASVFVLASFSTVVVAAEAPTPTASTAAAAKKKAAPASPEDAAIEAARADKLKKRNKAAQENKKAISTPSTPK
jgi:hypothetical protein